MVPHPRAMFSVLLIGGSTPFAHRYTRLSMACTIPSSVRCCWKSGFVTTLGDWWPNRELLEEARGEWDERTERERTAEVVRGPERPAWAAARLASMVTIYSSR